MFHRRTPRCRLRITRVDQPRLIEAISTEIYVLPQPHLQLARPQCPLYIDTCFTEPLQMVFPSLGVHDVEGFLPLVKVVLTMTVDYTLLRVRGARTPLVTRPS
jgi:hypothetical protein